MVNHASSQITIFLEDKAVLLTENLDQSIVGGNADYKKKFI